MMFAPVKTAPELSRRQRDVLIRLCRGDSGKQIAHALELSPRTIEEYVIRLRARFHARNAGHLCAMAVALGVIDAGELRRISATAEALGIQP